MSTCRYIVLHGWEHCCHDMTKLCNISCSYNTICHDIPYLILEVSNFIKHKFLLTLAMEFSNRIMLVSTYQYGLATMTYHVETVYVMTYRYNNILWQPNMARYCTHTHAHTPHTCTHIPHPSTPRNQHHSPTWFLCAVSDSN